MVTLIIVGILSLVCGVAFLMPQDKIKQINDKMNKAIVSMDSFLLTNHVGIGISLLALTVFCFFMVYIYSIKMR